jgi:hypothetical protein
VDISQCFPNIMSFNRIVVFQQFAGRSQWPMTVILNCGSLVALCLQVNFTNICCIYVRTNIKHYDCQHLTMFTQNDGNDWELPKETRSCLYTATPKWDNVTLSRARELSRPIIPGTRPSPSWVTRAWTSPPPAPLAAPTLPWWIKINLEYQVCLNLIIYYNYLKL